jgi:hypothetical protein
MCDEKDIKNESEAVSETPSCRFPLRAGGTEAERFPSRSGGNLKEGGRLTPTLTKTTLPCATQAC